jgi:hypothetical protein
LQADETVVAATGTAKNVGYASGLVWTTDSINFFLSLVVNHDLSQKVTAIQLSGPAASNTVGQVIINLPITLTQASKVINVPISGSVFYWLSNHLGYINIITSKNTAGAIRGQLIPTTTPRTRLPSFDNDATFRLNGQDFTTLTDGGAIQGDIANLQQGGARNITGNTTDPRVALFSYANAQFNNYFRFELPVTIKNRFVIRSAVFYITAAADVVDNNKFNVGLYDLDLGTNVNYIQIPGLGLRAFNTYQLNIDSQAFPSLLSAGGLYVSVNATSLSGSGLYVDRFFVSYYVVNSYANNIVKAIFYKGSSAE